MKIQPTKRASRIYTSIISIIFPTLINSRFIQFPQAPCRRHCRPIIIVRKTFSRDIFAHTHTALTYTHMAFIHGFIALISKRAIIFKIISSVLQQRERARDIIVGSPFQRFKRHTLLLCHVNTHYILAVCSEFSFNALVLDRFPLKL